FEHGGEDALEVVALFEGLARGPAGARITVAIGEQAPDFARYRSGRVEVGIADPRFAGERAMETRSIGYEHRDTARGILIELVGRSAHPAVIEGAGFEQHQAD